MASKKTDEKLGDGFDLNKLLEGLIPSTIEAVQSRIKMTVAESVVAAINAKSKEHAEVWFEREIAPALLKALNERRQETLAAALKASEDLTRSIAAAVGESIKMRIGDEWQRNQSLKKLLGLG